jgi:hypothetical protein
MRRWHKLVIAGLIGVPLAVALASSAPTPQSTRSLGVQVSLAAGDPIYYVDADATGNNNGTSWQDAFTDLQDGLTGSSPGGEIWVAEGTYRPTSGDDRTASFELKNGVALYGGFDPSEGITDFEARDWVGQVTLLSGDIGTLEDTSDNVYHVLVGSGVTETAVLDGFTVAGGHANGAEPDNRGGGIYLDGASPTLTNLTFSANSAGRGGGIYNLNSSPTLTHCAFSGEATDSGGGMFNWYSSPVLTDCTFSGNSAPYGGGMRNWYSSPSLTDCDFAGNSALYGGGMYNYFSESVALINCTFAGNTADYGGGLCNLVSSPTMINSLLWGNTANYDGGGMANYSASPALTNCTVSGNSADRGGGIYNGTSAPVLTNCILWGDSPDEMLNEDTEDPPVVTHSDLQGGCEAVADTVCGAGNLEADPRFVAPDSGDLHLRADSPCVDVGNDGAADLPTFDFEGDDRIQDGDGDGTVRVDLGVDEGFWYRVYLPVASKDW